MIFNPSQIVNPTDTRTQYYWPSVNGHQATWALDRQNFCSTYFFIPVQQQFHFLPSCTEQPFLIFSTISSNQSEYFLVLLMNLRSMLNNILGCYVNPFTHKTKVNALKPGYDRQNLALIKKFRTYSELGYELNNSTTISYWFWMDTSILTPKPWAWIFENYYDKPHN